MKAHISLMIFFITLFIIGCGQSNNKTAQIEEDLIAKKELQGVWINEDEEDVAFRIKGDTIYFPDNNSAPVYFRIEKDSFVMFGINVNKYQIVKRTPNLFEFVNQNHDLVKLIKGHDKNYLKLFDRDSLIEINQNRLIKNDTIVNYNDKKYHCYVQINPTKYKVLKRTYNDDGVEVDNVYYDNIIHLSVFNGNNKVFSSNIVKKQFAELIPQSFLSQAVLSDLTFYRVDNEGIHYFAILGVPDSSNKYMVELIISYDGKFTSRIKE